MLRYIYLILTLLGLAVPVYQFSFFIAKHGPDPAYFNRLDPNHVTRAFGLDIIIASAALLIFFLAEIPRRKVANLWICALLALLMLPSAALPLYFYLRQISIDKGRNLL